MGYIVFFFPEAFVYMVLFKGVFIYFYDGFINMEDMVDDIFRNILKEELI